MKRSTCIHTFIINVYIYILLRTVLNPGRALLVMFPEVLEHTDQYLTDIAAGYEQ